MASTVLPKNIGTYQVRDRLGLGAMAVVHRAWCPKFQREVALKVLAPRLADDPSQVHQFRREAAFTRQLNHAHVVACYEAGTDGLYHYMALEIVAGGDVGHYLEQQGGQLELLEALRIIEEAARGCEALETRGLIHRDLKPGNLFLDEQLVVKVGDLGIACPVDDKVAQATAGQPVGTPAYISPEQALGHGGVDVRSDIYSLGATLYKLCCGALVYSGNTPAETLYQVRNAPIPDPRALRPDLPESLADLILRCLAKDPSERYASMAVFLRALVGCRRDLLPKAREQTERRRSSEPTTERIGLTERAERARIERERLDLQRLASLARMVQVDHGGMRASIKLAPHTSFPRDLLVAMLDEAKIVFGIHPSAVTEASRSADHARRIVLATGARPRPGRPGRNVRGYAVPAVDSPWEIEIDDAGDLAWLHLAPGARLASGELVQVLKQRRVVHGLRGAVLAAGATAPVDEPATWVVAQATPPDPGQPAGFELVGSEAGNELAGMVRVRQGDVVGRWVSARPPVPGADVRGLPKPVIAETDIAEGEAQAGDGTRIEHAEAGPVLLATRTGLAQRMRDGVIRVVGALEIDGDLDGDDPAVESRDLILVRGNLMDGAVVRSATDIVVLGDCADAHIEAGGDIEIHGAIGAGDRAVVAGGTLAAEAVEVRPLVAGSVRVTGTVRDARITATENIVCGTVIGGNLTAGRSIAVDQAGDWSGVTTELWAGHQLQLADRAAVARLTQKRLTVEIEILREESSRMVREQEALERRSLRFKGADYVAKKSIKHVIRELRRLHQRIGELEGQREQLRGSLATERQAEARLLAAANDHQVAVTVGRLALPGVVAGVGDVEPEIVGEPRVGYRMEVGGAERLGGDRPTSR